VKVLLRLLNVLYQEALKFQGIFFQVSWIRRIAIFVVATTCQNGTCDTLTLAKLSVGYLVVVITRELNKEPLLHCSSIYINTMWSMLQQYLLALMSMPLPHVLLLRLPFRIHVS